MFKVLLLTFLLLGSFKAQALEIATDCSDLPMLQKAWETKYFYDFKFDQQMKSPIQLKCEDIPYKIIKALWFLDSAKLASAKSYYNEAKSLITQIAASASNFKGDDETDACAVSNATEAPGRITTYSCFYDNKIISNDSKSNYIYNLIIRTVTMVHEVRHIALGEKGRHVDCKSNGETKACDHQFTEDSSASAYSYEIIYLKDLMDKNQFDYEVKIALNKYIEDLLAIRFNH